MIEAKKNSAIYTPADNPDRMTFAEIDEMTKAIEEDATNVKLENL
jgi:hypothetical protein